jgi:hypothetical protein
MATNPSGVPGAMFDASDSTNQLGALCTGIGGGINSVYGPPPTKNEDVVGNGISLARIGSAPPYGAKAQACGFPGKVVTFQVNATAAAIPAGGVMAPGTSVNQSGKPVPVGGGVYAVAP